MTPRARRLGLSVTKNRMSSTDEKIDDLARMMAEGFTELKKDISEVRTEMATKEDLTHFRGDVEIMFDKFVGVVRKDIDGLAGRVKVLEEANT